MQNKFLVQFKNVIPSVKNKDNNLILTLSSLKKSNIFVTPQTFLINACENIAPGAGLLPRVRAGRVHYVPGKIKYLASMYKGIKWMLESVKMPNKILLHERLSIELKNILNNTGPSLNLKRNFIKELRAAQLNVRRRKFFNKFIKRKRYRRMQNQKNKKLQKKYKKLKINKKLKMYKRRKKKRRLRIKGQLYRIKKLKVNKKKFFNKKIKNKNLRKNKEGKEAMNITWFRIRKLEYNAMHEYN